MKSIVYYYSQTGRCEELAKKIATAMGCESEPIVEKRRRISRGFLRFLSGGEAIRGKPSPIKELSSDPAAFDTVVLVSPIWASSPTPALRGFVDAYGSAIAGKRIGLAIANLGSDAAVAFEKFRELFASETVVRSFTKAKGEWDNPLEGQLIGEFVSEVLAT